MLARFAIALALAVAGILDANVATEAYQFNKNTEELEHPFDSSPSSLEGSPSNLKGSNSPFNSKGFTSNVEDSHANLAGFQSPIQTQSLIVGEGITLEVAKASKPKIIALKVKNEQFYTSGSSKTSPKGYVGGKGMPKMPTSPDPSITI